MARPPRIEGAHLWYHVYNRGNEKRVVFHDDDDRNSFLDLLFESAALFAVDVHSFALMPNHFHLMITTREANLCQFMQQFQNKFIKVYNARHDRVGHVFQDRYRAIVVDSTAYGSELSRYIHLNIARSGTMKTAGIRERLATLRAYPWSSYRAYVGHEPPRWPVASTAILAKFGETPEQQQRRYARYVTHGLLTSDNPFEKVVAGCILGSEAFVKSITELAGLTKRHDDSAMPSRHWLRSVPLEETVAAVAKVFGMPVEEILHQHRSGARATARRVLLWAAVSFSAGRTSRDELGKRLGGITGSALTHAYAHIERTRAKDTVFATRLDEVKHELKVRGYAPPEDDWIAMCERLVSYKQKYGHTLVPRGWSEDIELGSWVHRQRLVFHGKARNAAPLTADQIACLDHLGFCWTIRGDKP